MEESTPLLNHKENELTAKTLDSIHKQLPSAPIEFTKSEQSLMDQIFWENDRQYCSPTCDDVNDPKKLVIKTVLTLSLAGLLDGGLSGLFAAPLAITGGPSAASFVCSPLFQGIVAPMTCCASWSRNCLPHLISESSHKK